MQLLFGVTLERKPRDGSKYGLLFDLWLDILQSLLYAIPVRRPHQLENLVNQLFLILLEAVLDHARAGHETLTTALDLEKLFLLVLLFELVFEVFVDTQAWRADYCVASLMGVFRSRSTT